MDELVLLGLVALVWLVVVPIVILVKLSGLGGKVREQEEHLRWKVAKLEERLSKLESGLSPGREAKDAPVQTAQLMHAAAASSEAQAPAAEQPTKAEPEAPLSPLPATAFGDNSLLSAPIPSAALYSEAAQTDEEHAASAEPEVQPTPETAPHQAAPAFQPPQPPPISDPLADIIKFGQQILRKSNMWVLGGTVLLLCALVFLAKLAIDAGWYTPSLRLATGGLLGIALLGFGWRSRNSKPQLGQILQGGGVAAFYLVVVAAVKLHDMIPPVVGLPLLLGLVLLASVLAVMQNAAWMAHVSMISGFLAPPIMSDGTGNYIALFSVFIALNLGVMLIFHFRKWGHLCLTGFLLTYGIGGIWGLDAYTPELWASVEPFLLAFTACYGWIAWRLNGLAAKEGAAPANETPRDLAAAIFSATRMHLFFVLATPAVFMIYQLTVVGHLPFAMAFTGLGLGFIYLAGATLTWKRRAGFKLCEAQIYFTLAITGLNLALLFAGLDTGADRAVMLFYLGVVWVVEGGLFVYATRRNSAAVLTRPRFISRLGAALFLIGSLLSYIYGLDLYTGDMSVYNGEGADINIHILAGTLLAAISLLASAWGCRVALQDDRTKASALPTALQGLYNHSVIYPLSFVLTALWLLAGAYAAFAEFEHNLVWSNLALAVFVSGAMLVRARLAWAELRCLLFLPLVLAIPTLLWAMATIWGVVLATELYDFTYMALSLEEFAYTVAPLILFFAPVTLDCLLSRRMGSKTRNLAFLSAPGTGFAILLACLPTLISEAMPASTDSIYLDIWFMLLPFILALLAFGLLTRLAPAYAQASSALRPSTRLGIWYVSAILPLILVVVWQLNTLTAEAFVEPLPYIPLLNPLDLGAALGCLALWFWWQKTITLHNKNCAKQLFATPGIVLICLMAFIVGHGVILRAVTALAYNSIYVLDAFPQQLAQICITLYWGACGFTLMLTGSKLKMRRLWICGALLMLAAAIKTVAVDTSSAATLAKVAVYFGMGVLYICTGYFIPVPGGRGKEPAPEEAPPSSGEK